MHDPVHFSAAPPPQPKHRCCDRRLRHDTKPRTSPVRGPMEMHGACERPLQCSCAWPHVQGKCMHWELGTTPPPEFGPLPDQASSISRVRKEEEEEESRGSRRPWQVSHVPFRLRPPTTLLSSLSPLPPHSVPASGFSARLHSPLRVSSTC